MTFGNLAILLRKSAQLKTHGFASPAFTGFAFVACLGAMVAYYFARAPYSQFSMPHFSVFANSLSVPGIFTGSILNREKTKSPA